MPADAGRDERNRLFRNALARLASGQISSEEERCEYVGFFTSLYSDDAYRHRYSDILSAIIDGGDAEQSLARSACLADNLHTLCDHADCPSRRESKCGKVSLADSLRFYKLLDHVDLESQRLAVQNSATIDALAAINRATDLLSENYKTHEEARKALSELNCSLPKIHAASSAIQSAMSKVEAQQEEIEEGIEESSKQLEEVEKKASNIHRDTIAIIGVFAAIVITFASAMIFSESVLKNVSEASPVRLLLIALAVGFVSFNMLVALLLFLNRMSNVPSKAVVGIAIGVDVVLVVGIALLVVFSALGMISL